MLKKLLTPLFIVLLLLSSAQGAFAATFSVSPSSGTYTAGDTIDVDIILDTEGEETIGADAIILFDSAKLEVEDASLGSLYGTKVTDGSESYGKIIFEAVALGSSTFDGSDTYATITFNAIADGEANVDIKFTSEGVTTDSNVTANDVSGTDLLSQVNNAEFTIVAASSSSTTTTATKGIGGTSTATTSTTKTTVPVSGHVENTIAMFLGGIGLLITGLYLKKQHTHTN